MLFANTTYQGVVAVFTQHMPGVQPLVAFALLGVSALLTTNFNGFVRGGLGTRAITSFRSLIGAGNQGIDSKKLWIIVWKVLSPILCILLYCMLGTLVAHLVNYYDISSEDQLNYFLPGLISMYFLLMCLFLTTTDLAGYVPSVQNLIAPNLLERMRTEGVAQQVSPQRLRTEEVAQQVSPQAAPAPSGTSPLVSPASSLDNASPRESKDKSF